MSQAEGRPVDPDVDLSDPVERAETVRREWDLLLVIALGGILGAEARYGLSRWVTHRPGTMPWSTVLINVVGAALIGALMSVVDRGGAPRLLRPFVGVGILGGFTTFSTFAVDIDVLLNDGRVGVAVGYLALSVAGCFVAVSVGYRLMRASIGGGG
jgi:CrcB protein